MLFLRRRRAKSELQSGTINTHTTDSAQTSHSAQYASFPPEQALQPPDGDSEKKPASTQYDTVALVKEQSDNVIYANRPKFQATSNDTATSNNNSTNNNTTTSSNNTNTTADQSGSQRSRNQYESFSPSRSTQPTQYANAGIVNASQGTRNYAKFERRQ